MGKNQQNLSENNTKPLKILHVIGGMVRGGAENWLMSLLQNCDKSKLQMDICVTTTEKQIQDDDVLNLGCNLYSCPLHSKTKFEKSFKKLLIEKQYDVVHSHLWLFSGVIMKIACKCNVPVRITYSHTAKKNPPNISRFLYKIYMQHLISKYATHKLGCSSEAMPEVFGKNWEKQRNCKVLYCSINIEKYKPDALEMNKAYWGLKNDDIIVGHIGDFREAKNHTFFLDVAKELIKIRPEIKFYFAGADGGLQAQVEHKIQSLNLERSIIIGGIRSDVPELMKYLFDALLFPSAYEGMPLVLIEAFAAGLRTVCSDTITPEATDIYPEAFTRLSLGLTAADWATAVLDAVKKGKLTRQLSYDIVKQSHFSTEYSVKKLMSIYDYENRFTCQ